MTWPIRFEWVRNPGLRTHDSRFCHWHHCTNNNKQPLNDVLLFQTVDIVSIAILVTSPQDLSSNFLRSAHFSLLISRLRDRRWSNVSPCLCMKVLFASITMVQYLKTPVQWFRQKLASLSQVVAKPMPVRANHSFCTQFLGQWWQDASLHFSDIRSILSRFINRPNQSFPMQTYGRSARASHGMNGAEGIYGAYSEGSGLPWPIKWSWTQSCLQYLMESRQTPLSIWMRRQPLFVLVSVQALPPHVSVHQQTGSRFKHRHHFPLLSIRTVLASYPYSNERLFLQTMARSSGNMPLELYTVVILPILAARESSPWSILVSTIEFLIWFVVSSPTRRIWKWKV